MELAKSSLLSQAFKIFREVYTEFLREVFIKKYGNNWLQRIQPLLKTSSDRKKHGNTYFDIPNILSLILGNWDNFLENFITKQERSYLFEVRNMRNRWAHQENVSSADLLRTLDSILRLLELHYFQNQEFGSASISEFDESKVQQVKKLKHYVHLKIAEKIERRYKIEKKRVRPSSSCSLKDIIFGKNKKSKSRQPGPERGHFNQGFNTNNNRGGRPPHPSDGFSNNFGGGRGFNNNNNNFGGGFQNSGFNSNWGGGGGFSRNGEQGDVNMMERNNRSFY